MLFVDCKIGSANIFISNNSRIYELGSTIDTKSNEYDLKEGLFAYSGSGHFIKIKSRLKKGFWVNDTSTYGGTFDMDD